MIVRSWPTVLVLALCAGLAAANAVRAPAEAVLLARRRRSSPRFRLGRGSPRVRSPLLLAGWGWGSARLDALDHSVLALEIGRADEMTVVVTGPTRRTLFALRVPAEVRRVGVRSVRERVLLELPLGRSPPQGAILVLRAKLVAPRGPEDGFDERGWLARRGVHVVLRGGDWRMVGRRGGLGGVGDRLRAHVERAIGAWTDR